MKKIYSIISGLLMTASVFLPQQASAQAPEKMSYQAVVRDGSNALVTSTAVGMKISILQTTSTGTAVYVETQTPTSNANGLVSLEIGTGTTLDDFSSIDWSAGPSFIKTETDPAGGTNYTITGTSELLSVPYALHAKTADTVTGGITETDPIFGASVASGITGTDTTYWNNKLDSYTETDPSVPSGTATGQMQYWNGSAWVVVAPGSSGQVLKIVNGVPEWKSEVGDNFVINFTTGKIWMDRNLGATQVATSGTDTASYGDLYQWGRGADGHQIRTSDTTSTLSSTNQPGNGNFILAPNSPYDWRSPQNTSLWQGVNGVNNPCPSGYRLPTEAELDAERASWSSQNAAGAFASPLKLPVAGGRGLTVGSISLVGITGYYWSSTVSSSESHDLRFTSGLAIMDASLRAYGFSVRCLKD